VDSSITVLEDKSGQENTTSVSVKMDGLGTVLSAILELETVLRVKSMTFSLHAASALLVQAGMVSAVPLLSKLALPIRSLTPLCSSVLVPLVPTGLEESVFPTYLLARSAKPITPPPNVVSVLLEATGEPLTVLSVLLLEFGIPLDSVFALMVTIGRELPVFLLPVRLLRFGTL
jgi:hypothetical protein